MMAKESDLSDAVFTKFLALDSNWNEFHAVF